MRFETPQLAFDVPDGYEEQPDDEVSSFVDEQRMREITVSAAALDARADVDEVLHALAGHRAEALRQGTKVHHATQLSLGEHEHLRVSSFVAIGENPIVSFFGTVVDRRPLADRLHLVTFCCYQYAAPGGPPDVDAFERECRAVLDTVVPMPKREALERAMSTADLAPGAVTNPQRLYPYLVPTSYVDGAPPPALGHGIHITFAEDFDGAAAIRHPDTLTALGEFDALMRLARGNLLTAIRERRITVQRFSGPRGLPALVFGPEWLAASCVFLPGLVEFCTENLGPGPFLVSIPHRDAMLVFRDVDAAYRSEMRALIAENEKDGQKPLTWELFRLTEAGVQPV